MYNILNRQQLVTVALGVKLDSLYWWNLWSMVIQQEGDLIWTLQTTISIYFQLIPTIPFWEKSQKTEVQQNKNRTKILWIEGHYILKESEMKINF